MPQHEVKVKQLSTHSAWSEKTAYLNVVDVPGCIGVWTHPKHSRLYLCGNKDGFVSLLAFPNKEWSSDYFEQNKNCYTKVVRITPAVLDLLPEGSFQIAD